MHRSPELLGQPLTRRETEVAILVAQGLPNKRVAWELGIAEGTIKQLVATIFRKTACDNRVQLTLWVVLKRKIRRVPLS